MNNFDALVTFVFADCMFIAGVGLGISYQYIKTEIFLLKEGILKYNNKTKKGGKNQNGRRRDIFKRNWK